MLHRFFAYYAPYKGLFALDFGCALVSALCGEEKARRIAAEVVHNVRK